METSEVTTTNSENTASKSDVNSDENENKNDVIFNDNGELTPTPKTEIDLKEEPEQQQQQNDNVNQELTWESVAAEIQAHEESSSQYEIIPDTQNEVNILTSEGDDNTIQTTTITTTIEDTITTTTPPATETPIVTQSDAIEDPVSQSTDDHLGNITDDIELLIKCDDNNHLAAKENDSEVKNDGDDDDDKSADKEQEIEKAVEEIHENINDSVQELPSNEIEITELKPDEISHIDDVVEGIEYTVVEADETTDILTETETESATEEIVLLPIDDDDDDGETDPSRSDENSQDVVEEVYIIKHDEDSTNITKTTTGGGGDGESAESVDDPDDKPKQVKPKKPRGRRPITDIPLHVLGRDITKPTEGVSNGGRTMPKPRLGVKVPYKNLTSQIVSKEEIQKEIMDRFKQRQEQNLASGDILFARKLTQRLAKRLGPADKTPTTAGKTTTTKTTTTVATATTTSTHASTVVEHQEKKNESKRAATETINPNMNNSDLIAILEGETDDPQTIEKHTESKVFAEKQQFVKDIEKEIALQQLRELPLTKNRIFKSRGQIQQNETNKITTTNKSSNVSTPKKTNENPTTSTTKKATETPVKNQDKKTLDVEPQLKAEQFVKTYTRKRRSFELETLLPVKKTTVMTKEENKTDETCTNSQQSSDVYVTKSSRIIKKKVIWDPDEAPIRSPTSTTTPKMATPSSSPPKQQQQQETQSPDKPSEKKPPMVVVKKTPTSPIKKPKRLTEVDRLLMDEGAVNMLYDVKQNDDGGNQDKNKNKNKKVISLDKAHKELMSKTNVIKNDLQQNTIKESGVLLRKKDAPSPKKEILTPSTVTRKKSKDSSKSSTHNSPPASPSGGYSSAEASRIIRRHSSSSFSSNDGTGDGDTEGNRNKKKSSTTTTTTGNNEPPKKKFKKPTEVNNKPNSINNTNNNNNNNNNNTTKVEKDATKYKTFVVIKMNMLVTIELNYTETKYYLTNEVLKELTDCLNELRDDNDCHVVSITSGGGDSFCHGLDYHCLVAEEADVRKNKATELADLVKQFIRCLLHFPKVIVAGIQGDCVGLGVTMLPLFDMVIASDTSTFSTPYGCLGCAPEAGFLLGIPYLNNHGLASELLYTSQTIKAEDAVRSGLITRLCWPEKYHNELKGILTKIASQSKQSIEATKAQLRRHLFDSTETLLDSSMDHLIEQWISTECQTNFAKYKVELN